MNKVINNDSLKVVLGIDNNNHKVEIDFSKIGNVVVSGCCKSGKTVCLNNIILNLALKNNPSEIGFILIDTKFVEFMKYKDLPHLVCPIMNEVSDLSLLLKTLKEEIRRREIEAQYSHLFVMIDEAFEFIVSNKKSLIKELVNIMNQANKVGIHFIIASQLINQVNNNIIYNVDAFINLRTLNEEDGLIKETIELNGHGDIIYFEKDKDYVHLQGDYLSSIEIKELINNIVNK